MKADATSGSTRAEWQRNWNLPIAALAGYSTIGLQTYAVGPFVVPLEQQFGWSRAEVMLGLGISGFVGIFLNIVIGLILDRFGPRYVGLTGVALKCGSFALLGTATGTILNWSALWVLVAIGVVLVQSTVWISAVAHRFSQSRGLAMAVALSGSAISASIAPALATWAIVRFGWREGFAATGGIWFLAAFPVVFCLFRERQVGVTATDPSANKAKIEPKGLSVREGIRTRAFLGLLVSFGTFSFYALSISANLVPLLGELGASAMAAAGLAAVLGLVGFVARLTVGLLLDRFPANIVGAIMQVMPAVGCAILLLDDPGSAWIVVAIATFGIAIGAEIDVALYIASRHFGPKAFGTLFSVIITFGAVNSALGPVVAGWLHDRYGNYQALLMLLIGVMILGAVGVASIGQSKKGEF